MINIEKFVRLGSRQIRASGAEKLQCIPLRVIVARADGDTAAGVSPPNRVLDDWRRNDAQVHNLVPTSEQTCDDAFADHRSAGARIASDEHRSAWLDEGSER